ncbi:MAG: helix-hairpin-helix domain-containing protein, partial [Thermodesulfobacteriota bacterium]|nr:helix-hairpin-helix domain-containing protein [Thermodesulfobacteriota bacterium]
GKWRLLALAKTPDETGRPERRAGADSDRVFLPGRKNPLLLKPGSLELLFLQGLRDAAHEFVLGRQRRTRKKQMLGSGLLSLPGIGPKTARLLWDRFGSVAAMREASPEEIAAVQGLGLKRAEKIFAALRELQG